MAGVDIEPSFGALLSLLKDGTFSDIDVVLADDSRFTAHRVLLAAASDMLRAKFSVSTCDSAEVVWQPEVGSPPIWHWIMGWIYGAREQLPWDSIVETLIVADYFQIGPLVSSIVAIDFQGHCEKIAHQLLTVKQCPLVLRKIATACVPSMAVNEHAFQLLMGASVKNAALVVEFLQFGRCSVPQPESSYRMNEVHRLILLGARLRLEESSEFPDCCVEAISWDAFPSELLAQVLSGSMEHFKAYIGRATPEHASATAKNAMVKALVARCQRLEQLIPQTIPQTPSQPIFAQLLESGSRAQVTLSSNRSTNGNRRAEEVLFSNSFDQFGTALQDADNPPWMEINSQSVIQPEAVGLMHGWSDSHYCKDFCLESSAGDGEWRELLAVSGQPLSTEGEVFGIPFNGLAMA